MRTFNKTQEDRKILVSRIQELTGEKLPYTGTPHYSYEGSGFVVTREGDLQVDDSVNQSIIDALIAEGLIKEQEPVSLTVSIPVSRHNGATLRNLVNLVFTRASLLNKALGTSFRVDEGLTDALRDNNRIIIAEDFYEALNAYEEEHGPALSGLAFESDKIIFSSLPETSDPAVINAFTELCAMMNKQALEQNRIQAKVVNEENEKYAMRIWLVRLGMNGSDHKETRKVLMENLSGHSAFRTDEERQHWQAKQDEKKEKLKAIKEEMRREYENAD